MAARYSISVVTAWTITDSQLAGTDPAQQLTYTNATANAKKEIPFDELTSATVVLWDPTNDNAAVPAFSRSGATVALPTGPIGPSGRPTRIASSVPGCVMTAGRDKSGCAAGP